jgi:Uma2 family endonuclease
METEVTKKLFTVDEYHRMASAGILREDERLELIDGEIIQMSPIGDRHALCVNRVTTLFIRAFGDRVLVSPQNPVRLSDWTEPQPDIVVFKPRADFYAKKRQRTEDVLLVLEVADSSLSHDLRIKLPRYAAAGFPELWIGDLQHDLLHVYRDPAGEVYKTALMFREGDAVSPFAFADLTFGVGELLSTDFEAE